MKTILVYMFWAFMLPACILFPSLPAMFAQWLERVWPSVK